MIMDVLRNGTITTMRLWRDDPTETEVAWFVAPRGAKVLSQLSYFRSSVWDKYSYIRPVGETKDNVRRWHNGKDIVPYVGDHFCGSLEAIMNGGVHGVDPPITTHTNGSCDCCSTPKHTEKIGDGNGQTSVQSWHLSQQDPIGDGTRPYGIQTLYVQTGYIGDGTRPETIWEPESSIYDGVGPPGVCQGYIWVSCDGLGFQPDTDGGICLSDYTVILVARYLVCKIEDGNAPRSLFTNISGIGDGVGSISDQYGFSDMLQAWVQVQYSAGSFTVVGSSGVSSVSSPSFGTIRVTLASPPLSNTWAAAATWGGGAGTGNFLDCKLDPPGSGYQDFEFNDPTAGSAMPGLLYVMFAW